MSAKNISATDRIQVCARFRPPNAAELSSEAEGEDPLCVDFDGGDGMRARVRNPHARTSTDFTLHPIFVPGNTSSVNEVHSPEPKARAIEPASASPIWVQKRFRRSSLQ